MRRSIIFLSALGWLAAANAANNPEYAPAPNWVQPVEIPAASTATDAAVQILLTNQQFNFSRTADESYVENAVRIQTPQGLAAMGTISLSWKPDTDVLTIHKVHLLRGEQVIDVLGGGQTFTVLRRESNLEYSALDGVLTATLQPTDLRVGDALNIAYTLKRFDPVLDGISEQIVGGWSDMPISRVRVKARWQNRDAIRWKASSSISEVKEQRNGDLTEIDLTLDNIEPIVQPKGAPFRYRVDRTLEFSGFKSWSEISRRLAPLYTSAAKLQPQSTLRAEIARIKSESSDPVAQVEAALSLVQDQVRYVFLGMNDGGLVPADADVTWSRRFGDCKAKTALLLAILNELGIAGEAVAVNTYSGDGLDRRLPMVRWFDHVVVRMGLNGKAYWLDGTRTGDRYLANLTIPGYSWGLPLSTAGSELVRIESAPLEKPNPDISVRIDATAGIKVPVQFQSEILLRGDAAIGLKLRLDNLASSEIDRELRNYWKVAYDFVEPTSVSRTFDASTGELKLSMSGLATMTWENNWHEITNMQVGYEADFAREPGPNHDAPFAVPFPIFMRAQQVVLLPNAGSGFTIRGENIDMVIAGTEYRRMALLDKGVLTATISTRTIKDEFPAAEAVAAQEALRKMAKDRLYLRSPDNYRLTDADVETEISKQLSTDKEYVSRGYMLMNRRDFDRAISDFDKALSLNPKSDMALANRGMSYMWKSMNDLAARDLDAAFAINPRNPVVFRGRGMLSLRGRLFQDAIDYFTTSLELDPGNQFALENRVHAYAQNGDLEKALSESVETIRRYPGSIPMYMFRAYTFRQQGKNAEALNEVKSLLAANTGSAPAFTGAGTFYALLGMDAEARQTLDRAVELSPAENTYLTRASVRPIQDVTGKLADVEAALRLNEQSVPALVMKGDINLKANNYLDAINAYNIALSMKKDDASLLTKRGIAYSKNNQPELASSDFTASERNNNSPTALGNMCWEMATAGVALSEALRICDAAVSKAPNVPAFLDSRAFALLRLGRYEDAIATYDDVLKLKPRVPTSLFGRGIAKLKIGDKGGGDADIEAALQIAPITAETFAGFGIVP